MKFIPETRRSGSRDLTLRFNYKNAMQVYPYILLHKSNTFLSMEFSKRKV